MGLHDCWGSGSGSRVLIATTLANPAFRQIIRIVQVFYTHDSTKGDKLIRMIATTLIKEGLEGITYENRDSLK